MADLQPHGGTDRAAVFVFATLRYDGHYSRMHAMVKALAGLGYEAVYVEPPNSVSPYHAGRGAATLNGWGLRLTPPPDVSRTAEGTAVLCVPKKVGLGPARLPLGRGRQERLQGRWLAQFFAAYRARHGRALRALITTARWEPLLRAIPFDSVIFDRVDAPDILKGWLSTEAYLARETALVRRSDLVLAVSAPLEAEIRQRAPAARTLLIPNGVDARRFRAAGAGPVPELLGLPRPILGFLGALCHWVDVELLAACARAYPEATCVLAGPVGRRIDLGPVRALPNVRLLGPVPYHRVPVVMQAFDVGLLPFRPGAFSGFANPITLFEYLALGKPVVCTPMADMAAFEELIYMSQTQFVENVARALQEAAPDRERLRQAVAAEHDWTALVQRVLAELPGRTQSRHR